VLAVTALGSVSGGVFWTGAFFLTRQHYRFTPTRNLLLAFAMGTAYAFVAWSAGRLTARLERQGPRRVVAIALALWALAAALPLGVPGREAGIWVGGVLGSGASGAVWPVIESYLGAGRHGADLRQALGRFNVTWTLRAVPSSATTGVYSDPVAPVIFVTPLSQFSSHESPEVLGENDLLAKPFLLIELTLKAVTHVERARLEK